MYVREVFIEPHIGKNEAEKSKLDDALNTCLVFPDNMPSEGRPLVHDIASTFQLAHHSGGSKKSRKVYVYPQTLSIEKQKQEKKRLEKDR